MLKNLNIAQIGDPILRKKTRELSIEEIQSSDVKNTQKPPVKNKPKAQTEKPKTSSGIKEIVKEKKIKKELPLRAKNDPRQKN